MITNMRIIKDITKRLYKKSGKNYILDFTDNCVRYKSQALYITDLGMFNRDYIAEYSYMTVLDSIYSKILNKDTSQYATLEPEALRVIDDEQYLSLYNIDTECYTDIKKEYINKIGRFYFNNSMIFKQTYNHKDLVYVYRKEDMQLLSVISPYIRK